MIHHHQGNTMNSTTAVDPIRRSLSRASLEDCAPPAGALGRLTLHRGGTMGALAEHAKQELQRAGMFDTDSDYGGLAGKAALELVQVFERQGHSGASAGLVLHLFSTLASFKALTPITRDPAEWSEVSPGLWQSTRQSDLFSHDGGRTGYSVDDSLRQPITFPAPAEAAQ